MPKLNTIFFDLDETLIENRIPIAELFGRMYHDFSDQLGADQKTRFFTELRSQAQHLWSSMFDTQTAPETQFIECFRNCINALNTVASTQQSRLASDMFHRFLELSANNAHFQDGALETLAELQSRGYTTGLITNGMEQVQMGKIRQLDLASKVDHVTVSAQARAHKPYQPVFELALSRANVKADQAWQVGDHATNDVAGAIRAGLGGIFYNPNELSIEESFADLNERPTHTIGHLSQLLELAEPLKK